ncbi:NACHT domain-containing protein [Nostoc sp.]|uniref:NACHT domain-containing protein n=1 Tax=Nostoc sp. TaxID=1180 RepID=UPI002FFA72E9
MLKLSAEIFNEIVDILRPLMNDEKNRTSLLNLAFGNDAPVLKNIDLSGNPQSFTSNMVCKLADYGEVASGKQAIWALLEYVRSQYQVGVDIQKRIDDLHPLIETKFSFQGNILGFNILDNIRLLQASVDNFKALEEKVFQKYYSLNYDLKKAEINYENIKIEAENFKITLNEKFYVLSEERKFYKSLTKNIVVKEFKFCLLHLKFSLKRNEVPFLQYVFLQKQICIKKYIREIINQSLQKISKHINDKNEQENIVFKEIIGLFTPISSERAKLINKIDAYIKKQKTILNKKLETAKEQLEYQRNQAKEKKIEEKLSIILSQDVSISLQTIEAFIECKPLKKEVFLYICSQIELEPFSIIDNKFLNILSKDLPQAKAKYRQIVKQQCGTLRILNTSRPIELSNLYVDVNILTEPVRYRRIDLPNLPQIHDSSSDQFNRWGLGEVRTAKVPGLKAVEEHDKLMILGKPGSGKTSFLQHIAVRCSQGEFEADRLPIFIRLKNFFDYQNKNSLTLAQYIISELEKYEIDGLKTNDLLKYGRILLLLDGLDEVSEEAHRNIENLIEDFYKMYFKNKIVLTCRIAAVGDEFEKFVYVEIADFNEIQIKNFAKNWFEAINISSEENSEKKATSFIKQLELPENMPIKELVVTPILLSLACLVFDTQGKFPFNRSELYEEALDILLQKWDITKRINRDEIYQNLPLKNKIELLTQIAYKTFEERRYFFKKQEICNYIDSYLQKISKQESAIEHQDSEAVLRSIESQHGILVERARNIYSFCQLTIQEYFTAKALIDNFNPDDSDVVLSNITSKSWREVFLIATGIMQDPDNLLISMTNKINDFAKNNYKFQNYIKWVYRKSNPLYQNFDLTAARAFYFILDPTFSDIILGKRNFDEPLSARIDNKFKAIFSLLKYKSDKLNDLKIGDIERKLLSEISLMRTLSLAINNHPESINEIKKCLILSTEDNQDIEKLTYQLSSQTKAYNNKGLKKWWKSSGKIWIASLREVMIKNFDIGYDWQFSKTDIISIKKYYDAHSLVFDCIDGNRNKIKKSATIINSFF